MNSDSPAAQSLRDRRRQATRQEILRAAEAVFGESGIAAARMEEIATRSGVSVGTLYNYFDDRDTLLEALWRLNHDELLTHLDAALEAQGTAPFTAQLEAFVSSVMRHFQAHWHLLCVMMEAGGGRIDKGLGLSRASKTMAQLYDRAAALCDRGVKLKALGRQDAAVYPAVLLGMLRGIMLSGLVKSTPLPADATPALVRIFLHGAVATPVKGKP